MQSEYPQKFGAYVLLGPLGEGGMGAVYLAMSGHQEMETLCVVKRLLPSLRSQPEHVRRFRHEADLARRLGHSNLVHTHNIGEVEGEVFLVQEFVEGHDVSALLDELYDQRQALPVPIAVHIAGEIARGLSYAHAFERLQLVHRDINPPNIRVTYAGEVKLLDFGIASSNLHGDVLAEHRGAGKLWHLAPEQVKPGGVVDRRTDIYALGVVLWELLTQRPVGTIREGDRDVRKAETEGEVMLWITRGQHQPPSTFNPAVPPELDALVAKATHVNPEYRHASAEDFRRELSSFIPQGSHPESSLSAMLADLFSPDVERAERQRMIEAARHLLSVSAAHGRAGRRASDVPTVKRRNVAGVAKRWLPWLAPVGALALVGAIVLVWPGSPDRSASEASGEERGAGGRTVTPSRPSSPPTPSPPAARPDIGGPSPGASQGRAAPAGAVPAKSQPNSTTAAAAVRADGPVPAPADGRPQPSVAVGAQPAAPAEPPKLDHLRMARDAFNVRDWARALAEGKNAVAAGEGAEAHALLGNTYFKMGRYAEAEQQYGKAVALDPKNRLLQERLRIAHVRAQER